ncbi:MAG: DUF3098 domain-containing protein, partial [Saprospiraceae bacterium]|nr:DUF3098 domain-containing protein [Saprospiraceae bacterium]
MAKQKKVVVTTQKVKPTKSNVTGTATKKDSQSQSSTLIFGKENYKWIGIGLVLIFGGMLLMIGGFNED